MYMWYWYFSKSILKSQPNYRKHVIKIHVSVNFKLILFIMVAIYMLVNYNMYKMLYRHISVKTLYVIAALFLSK